MTNYSNNAYLSTALDSTDNHFSLDRENDPWSLSVVEAFVLSALEPSTGSLRDIDPAVFAKSLAAAVLMDLSLADRIDNDINELFILDPTPLNDSVLDSVLDKISKAPVLTPYSIGYWIDTISSDSTQILYDYISRLTNKGLLKDNPSFNFFFWMMPVRTTKKVSTESLDLILENLKSLLIDQEVPSSRDIMFTGLLHSCGLLKFFFNQEELNNASGRIHEVAGMDLISQHILKPIQKAEI
ncbi:MAG: GPP34 family phosphoprotein [Alphaproteobacteria bacterium]|nr:GPP34 family phosphoprotein [Alphaproteobacteria bacterium]MCL2504650.1 GPP34 family phosphoprotein [Alphaproteobacteria bacterium]